MRRLDLELINDIGIRDAIETIEEELRMHQPWMKGIWKFLEYNFTASGSSLPVPHGLDFAPSDVIIIGKDAEETAEVMWTETDSTNIYMDIGGAVTVRMFIGHHTEEPA